jgi:hypothetical protein
VKGSVPEESRERDLESALFSLYQTWWRELGWRAEKFRQMIVPGCKIYKGGVGTVRHLIYKRKTTGLDRLANRPELTIEHLVLSGQWDDLFDDKDRTAARMKLRPN